MRARWKILAALNTLFFGGTFVTLVLAGLLLPRPLYSGWRPNIPELFLGNGWLGTVLGIFIINLVLSSIIFITLPGAVLFPLSGGFLAYRAYLWGLVLYSLPAWLYAVSLPVILLKGEAYVFAGAAGTLLGTCWIRPAWAYPGAPSCLRGEISLDLRASSAGLSSCSCEFIQPRKG